MAVQKLNVEAFLELAQSYPVLDVRSPGEYKHARIPGAHSMPLFSDEERKVVGTTYKQQSREKAIKVGLDYFGPKMRPFVEQAEALTSDQLNPSKTILVHCWRGGMRSGAIAWLLDLYGFKVYSLVGGYKKFRNWVIDYYKSSHQLSLLGGYTGSGKTWVLKELAKSELVLDLEALASHKGSTFGHLGMPEQPTQEQFENLLSYHLYFLKKKNADAPVWLEDESQRIGHVNIPHAFWAQMRAAPLLFLDIPFEKRLEYLELEYGSLDKEKMVESIERIQKRLGPLETKTAIAFLREGNIKESFRILLKYYDKYYTKGLLNRADLKDQLKKIECADVNALATIERIKQVYE
ncbi:MAG: tRNA 2-selenouridine(34) synthase MnmH [Chitinophagaceae bacterium]|nr:tRNA 2-selenouridine(34) synthase MnmH [Chitinophagaceae bacterium]